MRILLTTHAFPPDSVAGVEVYTARLARALHELGHEVAVLTAVNDLAAPALSVRQRRLGPVPVIEVVNARLAGDLASSYRPAGMDEVLARLLDDLRPQCVHVQHLLNLSVEMFPLARARGIPALLTLHDYWLSCARDGLRQRADGTICERVDHETCARCLARSPWVAPPLQRGGTRLARALGLGRALHGLHGRAPRLTAGLLALARTAWVAPRASLAGELDDRTGHLRRALGQADAVLAPTAFARQRALEWGVPLERLRLVGLGAVEGPARPRRAGPRRRLGYVGTLAPHKGAHVLLESLAGLPGDWTLQVAGNPSLDPSYAARLRALARDDARVRFVGPVAPADMRALWGQLDLLVLPSLWWENSPLSVLEGLAAGLPVVASRIGGVPELLPEGAGLLVPPGDRGALREALGAVVEGRLLCDAGPALPVKTALEGARELSELYATLCRP